MDKNVDPRDETIPRPQVSFTIRPDTGPKLDVFHQVQKLQLPYHDLMFFDATSSGTPGLVRFDFDTPQSAVDQAARWLQALPIVLSVQPSYGPTDGAA